MLERALSFIPGKKSGRALAIAVAAGLLLGLLLVPRAEAPSDPKAPLPDLLLLGQKLPEGDAAPKVALERVRKYAASKLNLELGDGKRVEAQVGDLGGEIDKVRLATLV